MSTQDTGRDYPVIDRVHDDEDENLDLRDERDGRDDTGAAVLDERADTHDADTDTDVDPDVGIDTDVDTDVDPDVDPDVDDGGPAHRADTPVDAAPGESDPAGPGDPMPGEGLSADDTRDRRDMDTAGEPALAEETTVLAVEDVPAQDPTLATVPPVTDHAARGTGPVEAPDADTTTGPPVETMPVPGDATPDSTPGTAEDFEATWRELQGTFVDDPAAAVRGAADLLERAVAELRQTLEGTDSTEDLRNAFRKYRDLFRSLH